MDRKVEAKEVTSRIHTDDEKGVTLQLKPSSALGFHLCGRSAIVFASEHVVIYPVANHLVLYDLETRFMEFFQHIEHIKWIQNFHLSPNRELLVVTEVCQPNTEQAPSNESVIISPSLATSPLNSSNGNFSGRIRDQYAHALAIYKMDSKIRLRCIPLSAASNVVSCSFSTDNKFLAVLEDAPMHLVTYWKVANAKLVASCKCSNKGTRISISPTNSNFISLSGHTMLKYCVWTNNEFESSNFLPHLKDEEHFVDHTWLNEYMIALSEHGLVLYFRITLDGRKAEFVNSTRSNNPSHIRMECISSHGKGFVLGGSAGFFSVYEASADTKVPFSLIRSVSVGEIAFDTVSVSPSSETIVACSKTREMFTFAIKSIETGQEETVEYRQVVEHGHQVGPVLQVDTCALRSIVVSCGTDKTVRVWNYELNKYELQHQCTEEPTAIGIHPSGFQLVVAFKERVRIYQLLHESLRQMKDLQLKACRFVRYAHGGHLFACASGLTVTTFQAYTLNAVHTLSGHSCPVRFLSWNHDDNYLSSAAYDGAVYRWDISKGSRSEESQHVIRYKHCRHEAFAMNRNDLNVVVMAGNDGKIREITAGEETKCFNVPTGMIITSMVLTRDSKWLLAGTKAGSILISSWPLSKKNLMEYFVHAESILQLCMTENDEQLVTCAEDGCVRMFKVLNCELLEQENPVTTWTRARKDKLSTTLSLASIDRCKKAGVLYTDAVLVARDDLEEQYAQLINWQERYEQVKSDVDFALHRKENEWINRLNILKDESEHFAAQERKRYEELEARHLLITRKHTEEFKKLEIRHVQMTQELENQYEKKLAQRIAQYDALSEMLERTRQECKALIEAQDTKNRSVLHSERKTFYGQAKEQNEIIKQLHEDLKYNRVKYEEVLHQEETDKEQEVETMRTEFAIQLETERQNTAVKEGQLSAANAKLELLRKKMQELRASSHARDMLLSTERAKLTRLKATLVSYEQRFEVSQDPNHEKVKTINRLKSENRILEKHRSVLSHRIQELETQQAPIQNHVRTLETTLCEKQNELADEFRAKTGIQQELENKDASIRNLQNEVKKQRQSSLQTDNLVASMKREFTRLAQLTNFKDLEKAVKNAYKVFVMGETLQKKRPLTSNNITAHNNATPASPSDSGGSIKLNTNAIREKMIQQQTHPDITLTDVMSDKALGYDCMQSVNESFKQVEHMSRTIQSLRTALDHAKFQTDRIRRESVAKGNILINECNRLRKNNKLLQDQIRDLQYAMYVAKRDVNNSDDEQVSNVDFQGVYPPSSSQRSRSVTQLHSRSASSLQRSVKPSNTSNVTFLKKNGTMNVASVVTKSETSFPESSPCRTNATMMSFTQTERELHDVAEANELTRILENEKPDIQRVDTQGALLLLGATDMISLSSSSSAPSLDASQDLKNVTRIGSLRPLTFNQKFTSLASPKNFVAGESTSPDI